MPPRSSTKLAAAAAESPSSSASSTSSSAASTPVASRKSTSATAAAPTPKSARKNSSSVAASPNKNNSSSSNDNNKTVDEVVEDKNDVYRNPRDAAKEHRYQFVHNPQDHDVRKRQILEKYGDKVRALMVVESRTKWDVLLLVFLQMMCSVLFMDCSWPVFVGMAYVCGTSMTHALFLAIHEITHYTVFQTKWMNSALAMVANIPIVFPYAMMFRDYHADHHRYLGWEDVDTDLPTNLELKLLDSFPGRLFFLTFQIFFYALRPMLVIFKPMRIEHWINWAVVFGFDLFWYRLWGNNYWPLVFLALSLALSGAISPTSGHFVSEHYTVWSPSKRQETFSYYGPWNFFCFNVGYHNEHHDFPSIPWTKLPELRRIAPEYYDPLVQPPSWFDTSMNFLFNGSSGIYNRVKREHGCRAHPDLSVRDKEVNPDLETIIPAHVQKKFSASL